MTKKKKEPMSDIESFWSQYPDAPYLLKVSDIIFLASSEQKAKDLARVTGQEIEKIFNPSTIESKADAAS